MFSPPKAGGPDLGVSADIGSDACYAATSIPNQVTLRSIRALNLRDAACGSCPIFRLTGFAAMRLLYGVKSARHRARAEALRNI
jgi:hypothetical protein